MKFEALRTVNLSKRGVNNITLNKLSLSLYRGEILGLIGENISDNELLLQVLSGGTAPDSGTIYINEKPVHFGAISDAQKAGIYRLWREPALIQEFSVAKNICIARAGPSAISPISEKKAVFQAGELLDRFGISMNPRTKAEKLPPLMQSIIMLVIASLYEPKIIIIDNVLSAYSDSDLCGLLPVIRQLQEEGVSFILNESNLDKMLYISDRVVLIKNGRDIGSFYSENIGKTKINQIFIGHSNPVSAINTSPSDSVLLEARGLNLEKYGGLDFYLRPGEMVGLVDLTNERASDILKTLGGMKGPVRGDIRLQGSRVDLSSPEKAVENKVGYISDSADISPGLSILENLSMLNLQKYKTFLGGLNSRMLKLAYNEFAGRLDLQEADPAKKASVLGEHDRLKVFLYRYIACGFKVLLLDNPFAKKSIAMNQTIYRAIQDALDQRMGIIVYSPNLSDIALICSRFYVIKDGGVSECSPDTIRQLSLINSVRY